MKKRLCTMNKIPKLDNRNYDDLMSEVKKLARQYTPEWNFDENSDDFGVVFAKLFCHMTESTISRYNKTSYNHYLTFLNMLGTHLRPAAPAAGMVIVKASEGTEGAYIEKGEPLYADADTEDGTVIYETCDALSVVDTGIKSIYFTEPSKDYIGCVCNNSDEDFDNPVAPFRIFDNLYYKNLQCHELYFWDDTVFNMSASDISFSFYNSLSAKGQKLLSKIFSDPKNVTWEYYNGEKWTPVDFCEEIENGVRIKFEKATKLTEIMGVYSRFVRCRFNRIPPEGISVTAITYRTFAEKINIDGAFTDETELSEKDFFPFGEQYNMYNTFSFMCDEAFSKKGATIEVSADIQFVKVKIDAQSPIRKYKFIMSEMDFADLEPDDIQIEKVKWEYWNGTGWARLVPDNSCDEFFKVSENKETLRTFKFRCPDNIEKIGVGSSEGYFIRARISKMRDRFDFYANYITPYIHGIQVKYEYECDGHIAHSVMVKSDLREYTKAIANSGITPILEKYLCDYPAMYIHLSRPLSQGMIRIFIDIEDGVHRFNPSLKWEYFADDHRGGDCWKHIDVMDATDGFSHSETVTLIGKNDFKETTIFGKTGYFIRVVNPDGKYSDDSNIAGRPVINDIKFGAVRVIQKDTREPEYFSIEQDEEDKLCTLSSPNASNVSVWVDEMGKISTFEQDEFLKKPRSDVKPEYDSLGRLERLWIKWEPTANLVACGINDRVYEVDYPRGEILFGNGRNGKIPPPQYNESIRINYSVCNGSKGNIDSHSVKDFLNTISNIDSIDNPAPIMGGVDMETIDSAASRMFGQISGGNRLVSVSDFENSICFNDRNIYKVKCIAHIDEDSNPAPGVTSVAVLPREFLQGYDKFQGIKNRIWQFLDEKAPATLSNSSRLRIFEVGYVETCVSVDVAISDFNSYQKVYKGIESRLKEFLNPVSGNFSHKGWGIGDFPRKELIYNYIKSVPGIKWIKSINVFTKLVTPEGKKEIDFENIKDYRFVVPVFGEPNINISVD